MLSKSYFNKLNEGEFWMKRCVLLAVSFLMATMLFAGPFGLEMGMTLEEIREKCGSSKVKCIDGDVYDIRPPKSSELFPIYYASIDDAFGLYCIKVFSSFRSYSDCLLLFNDLAKRFEAYYGKSQNTKKVKDIPPVYITFSPDTIIQYQWELPQCKKLGKEKIASVIFSIEEITQDQGCVMLSYKFNNAKEVLENNSPF